MIKRNVILLVLLTIVLVACSSKAKEKVEVFEVEGFSSENGSLIDSFEGTNDVQIFKNAVESATKIDGIADVFEPIYKFRIGNENYFLWLHTDGGTIMNVNDTHTLYKLSEASSLELKKMMKFEE